MSRETASRSVVAMGWRERDGKGLLMGTGFFEDEENVLK